MAREINVGAVLLTAFICILILVVIGMEVYKSYSESMCEAAFTSGFRTSTFSYEDDFIRFNCFTPEAKRDIVYACKDDNLRFRTLGKLNKHRYNRHRITPSGCYTDFKGEEHGSIFRET